jgi:hypothetical protein
MTEYISKWMSKDQIVECYEFVKEWVIWVEHNHIGSTRIKVRVEKGNDERYYFYNSHAYQGSNQAGPYTSSDNSAASIEEAIKKAKSQLFLFFDTNDSEAKWVELNY